VRPQSEITQTGDVGSAVTTAEHQSDSGAHVKVAPKKHVLTPREVLSWLPKDATPAQQDSAIQKHIKISEIHWSSRPDTLHLPGHSVGKSYKDVSLPQYYKESFFAKDSLFHPELSGGRMGVAGDPVPYSIASDNLITLLLFFSFVIAAISFAKSRRFIDRQLKNFVYIDRGMTTPITETAGEMRFQFFLGLQTCLMFAIAYFGYTLTNVADTFTIEYPQIIGIYVGVFAIYFLFKGLMYAIVGNVFFNKKKNEQWMKAFLFLTSCEGVALFPIVLLQCYFNLSTETAIFATLFVVILFKILIFYKTYIIFFSGKSVFLQNILYFCALEMMPLAALWGVLALINGQLRINF